MIKDYLEHYGAKGMKWGVRKDRKGSGKGTSSPKSAKGMSDAELKTRVNRLNMEKQYSDLVNKKSPNSSVSKGHTVVTGIVASAAKETAKSLVSEGMTKAMKGYVLPKAASVIKKPRG